MNRNEERRYTPDVEVRNQDDAPPRIVGHAAVWDSLSEDLGGFQEVVRRGTFTRALKENADIRALFNHSPDLILGRSSAGTLKLEEDEIGLRFEILPPDTTLGRDLLESIRRGDVSQVSFGFQVQEDRFSKLTDGTVLRELLDVDLFDVSPVVYPAYPQTTAEVRSRIDELTSEDTESESNEPEEPCEKPDPLRIKRMKLDLLEK
jgi:hypothetical protein